VIYRHHIAPPRAFTQFSHDLIRHPRLSSDAVRLLTWQLSLPEGARESLSRTAERARIGACAFTRAKRQLKEEGFVHERRLQGPGGHWVTQQLVSNVPLAAAEAAKLLGRMPVHAPSADASPQVAPSPRIPAVGTPTPPSTTDDNGVRRLAEDAEEAWLNRLADEAESVGTDGSVSLEEMAALLRRRTGGIRRRSM
jgi:hypothetical protein